MLHSAAHNLNADRPTRQALPARLAKQALPAARVRLPLQVFGIMTDYPCSYARPYPGWLHTYPKRTPEAGSTPTGRSSNAHVPARTLSASKGAAQERHRAAAQAQLLARPSEFPVDGPLAIDIDGIPRRRRRRWCRSPAERGLLGHSINIGFLFLLRSRQLAHVIGGAEGCANTQFFRLAQLHIASQT